MIPNETLQHIDTIGSSKIVGDFRITAETQARILMTLSDKIYTRKELAVIRETSTNAADAHIMVGKSISDIIVTLPTLPALNFRIRDFGDGLTEIEIRDIFCVFGESTKRQSNDYNGVLGYGAKSPFCASDAFTVTSWCNGEKSVYQCIKGDSTKLHSSILLLRILSDEPTGIEICVPVKQNAQYSYHREAINFYRHWPVMPTIKGLSDEDVEAINRYRSTPATLKGKGWEVRRPTEAARGIAYMGWVPYYIDWNVLYHHMALDSKSRALFDLLKSNDVILYFNMGEVNFVDSREQLEYTEKTLAALVVRIKEIFAKIKDSIQDKFVGLPTLWHAKIMYNAIFGTGVLETEKGETETAGIEERIKILEGNLLSLEQTFNGAFSWDGITLDGPSFTDINRFDNSDTAFLHGDSHEPVSPVMITYRKKKSRVKSYRCKSGKCDKIVCSPNVAVIVNDTGRKTGQQMAARYLIFNPGEKGVNSIRTVHVLTFENDAIKSMFFKEYSFYSVPVLKLSEVLPEAKKWNNLHKVSRNYGGGGGGARPMQYIDLEQGSIEEADVPVREIEEGGYYVQLHRRRRGDDKTPHIKGKDIWMDYDADDITASLMKIREELDLDVDRVYIISEKTSEAKWFKEVVASGDWTLLWTAIDEALPNLAVDVDHLVDANNYEDTPTVCEKSAKMLTPLILDAKSPILHLLTTVSGRDYKKLIEIKDAFKAVGLWDSLRGEHKGTIDFNKASETARASYPYLPWDVLEYDSYASEEAVAQVAKYINSADLFEKLKATDLLSAVIDSDCSVNLSDNCPSTTEVVS